MSIKQNKYLSNILYVYKLSNSCLSILTSSYSSSWGEYNFNITPVFITLYLPDLTSKHLTDSQDFTVYRSHRYKRFYSFPTLQIQEILQFSDLTDPQDFTVFRPYRYKRFYSLQISHILKILQFTSVTYYIRFYRSQSCWRFYKSFIYRLYTSYRF